MAEEQQGQEKTEEATPRKLSKAKDEGQVARSRELNSVAVVTLGGAALGFSVPMLADAMFSVTKYLFSSAGSLDRPMRTST